MWVTCVWGGMCVGDMCVGVNEKPCPFNKELAE